jgi:hypothetical protein
MKNKKQKVINNTENIEKDDIDETLDEMEKGYNKVFNENIFNFLNILKEPDKKTYFTNKTDSITNQIYIKNPFTSLNTQIPAKIIPPSINNDKPNENLLEDLKFLDKKLDEIIDFVVSKNIETDIIDNNLKNHINLLREIIDYKVLYLNEEITYKFGKKTINNYFYNKINNQCTEISTSDESDELLEYNYKKKIFI